MKLEQILSYFTHHVESFIQWFFLVFLALVGYLIARGLLKREENTETKSSTSESTGAVVPAPELEAMLNRILDEKAAVRSPQQFAQVDAQVQALKRDLAAKEQEISTLKQSSKSTEESSELSSKIKELEALSSKIKELEKKLEEYSIFEDDIADLSLYKEENVRLKNELEKLKAGGAVASVSGPAAEASTPTLGADMTRDLKMPNTGDPMADFESALKIEKQRQAGAPVAETAAPAPVAETAAPAPPAPDEAEDLFAEFASSSKDEPPLDTDKMVTEMEALASLQPTNQNALEESVDTEKMASEASSLVKS